MEFLFFSEDRSAKHIPAANCSFSLKMIPPMNMGGSKCFFAMHFGTPCVVNYWANSLLDQTGQARRALWLRQSWVQHAQWPPTFMHKVAPGISDEFGVGGSFLLHYTPHFVYPRCRKI